MNLCLISHRLLLQTLILKKTKHKDLQSRP
jgi:hypothetical protein